MVISWKMVTKQCLKTAIVVLLPCVGARAIYEDFSYMMPCTLKTAGIGLESDITGFPMLVRLTESRHRQVFQTAQSNGSDIRFSTKASALPLSFEIERWDLGGADSAAEIWVRIDTVKAAADRVILMHWGNASAPAGSDAASVFAAGGGFRGVWHLGETGSGTVREDATVNDNDLSPRAMEQSGKSAAMIGLADSLACARLVSQANPAHESLRSIPGGLTISCWIFLPGLETQTYLNMPGMYRLSNDGGGVNSGKEWFAGRAPEWWKYSTTVKQTSTWYHVAATYDASDSTLQYYLNGVPDGAYHFPATIGTVGGGQFIIGSATADHPENCLNGVIDEVRVEAATRDAGWMKLCYLSQKRDADIVRYAPAETRQAGPPEILSHPQPVEAPVGTTARFSVTVVGNGVTYQWLKNGAPIVDAGSASYETPTLTLANDGEIYRCVVGNAYGKDTTWGALLTVTQPPPAVSGVSPLDTLVPLGGRAVFSVQASGAPPLQYTWFRVGDGVVGSAASLEIVPDSREAWHGSRYYCQVSNARGSARSDTVLLRVVGPLAAAFDVAPTKGQDSLRAVFTDRSTGSIKEWRWYFGDGDSARYVPADNPGSLTHVYRGEGEYVCTLVVVGEDQSGTDTAVSGNLFVYPPGNNDITLSARFLASDRLEVSFTGADRVNTNPVLGPAASQVGLWVNREGGEIDPATHPRVAVFELAQMQGASPYVAVVTVPPSLTALQRRYNLWASPLWDQGPSAYSAKNAAEVVMKPLNALQLEGEFAGCPGTPGTIALNTDSLEWARVRVKATATVDTVGVGGIALSYGYAGGDILRVDTIPAAALGSSPYTWDVWNKGFFADTQQVVARAVQVARNGLTSDPVETRFYVGWPRPTNPAGEMRAQAALSSQVRLNWRWVGPTTGVDRVLLWQDTKPLPAGSITPGAAFTPETLQVSDSTYLVEGLNKETRYYFALQVRKNLLWSPLTVEASASDSTPSFTNNDSVPNTVAIDTAWFETGSNGIRIVWRVDTIPGVRMEWGIRSGLSRAEVIVPSNNPPRGPQVESVRETTLVTLEDMLFDTTYYVGIWLRGLDGPWSLPTDSSLCAVRSPSFTWEAVTYFTGGDTVFAFNNNVILRKGPGYGDAFPVEDTVDYFVPEGMPPGLIPASIGVSLRKGSYSDRQKFFVGIRYNPALPAGRTTAHLALFRPRGGTWEVEHESFARDGYVWVETSRFLDAGTPTPFVAMVDTVAPSIGLPDTGRVAVGGEGLSGSLSVRDNCGNVEWMVHYARDGEAFSEEKTFKGVLCGSCDSAGSASWSFPPSHVTERIGVRAHLVVSDGVYRDTVNVSHRARRENSDPVTTEKMEWVPVFATSRLEKPGVTEALSGLAGDEGVWDYDTRAFRLFRWVRTAANAGTPDNRWVEYSEENKTLFTFEPGRLLWLKTRKRVPVGLGPGTTLSLKDPFSMSLAAQEWTDMAVPFGFDVAVADVVGATGEAGRNLQYYRWERQETSEFGETAVSFRTVPVYVAGIPTLDDPGAKLVSAPLRGHSIFNPAAADVVLRIPPLPAGVRAFGAGKRRGATGAEADVTQWSVRLPAKSGSGVPLNTAYCGYRQTGEGTSYYGFAPTFARQSIRVRDPETGTLYGHAVHHETAGEGCAFLVAFCNDGPRAQTIVCRPEQAVRPPSGAVVRMVDPDGGAMKDTDGQWAVRVDAGRREDRFLLVGTEQYCASFGATLGRTPAKLVGCRFKRVGAHVELRYTLPWSGVSIVRFEAFDLRGRALWSHASRPARGGRHVLVWNARAEGGSTPGAGIYVVRMSVYDEAGGRMARFERRLDIIP